MTSTQACSCTMGRTCLPCLWLHAWLPRGVVQVAGVPMLNGKRVKG